MTPSATGKIVTIPLTDWVWIHPATWSTHKLGKNYGARLSENPDAPTQKTRDWLPKDNRLEGIVMRELAPGDAFELGSSDVDNDRKVITKRLHGVVRLIGLSSMTYQECANADEAVKLSGEMIENLPLDGGAMPFIQRQVSSIDKSIRELQRQRSELLVQAQGVHDRESKKAGEVLDNPSPPDTTDITPEPNPVTTPAPQAPNLPLHKLMAPPDDGDEDEDELTPAQIAAMSKYK